MALDLPLAFGLHRRQKGIEGYRAVAAAYGDVTECLLQDMAHTPGQLVPMVVQRLHYRVHGDGGDLAYEAGHLGFHGGIATACGDGPFQPGNIVVQGLKISRQPFRLHTYGVDDAIGREVHTESGDVAGQFLLFFADIIP